MQIRFAARYLALLGAAGLIAASGALAQSDEPAGERVALPDEAAEEARTNAEHGMETANQAREAGREMGETVRERARERRRDGSSARDAAHEGAGRP